MIITNCAACAAPLAHNAPRCVRCLTRYCSSTCQHDHWGRGHEQICEEIHRGGDAEQYHADRKYEEAAAVAVEACAADTAGQTCYICYGEGDEEGLVRGCSCRGTSGFAHMSCLTEQAKILREQAEENNLGVKVKDARWARWHTCGLCEQRYHGVVKCALGWACWKTYVGRPEGEKTRGMAMTELGNGLHLAGHYEEALSVKEADLSWMRRFGGSKSNILVAQTNLSNTYSALGRKRDAMRLRRVVYSRRLRLHGEEHGKVFGAASNYAISLLHLKRFEKSKAVLRKTMPVARRVLGDSHELMLRMKKLYAQALYRDPGATLDDLREAVTTLAEAAQIARRVLGGAHPETAKMEENLQYIRATLGVREAGET